MLIRSHSRPVHIHRLGRALAQLLFIPAYHLPTRKTSLFTSSHSSSGYQHTQTQIRRHEESLRRKSTVMPTSSEMFQFLSGQMLQTPPLPTTSFSGQTVIITGANTGLGLEAAKQLYVYLYNVKDLDIHRPFSSNRGATRRLTEVVI